MVASNFPVPTSVAHPVKTLREYSTNFEAALSVCLADPKVKAVHKLRTDSRRLEAQIALIESLKGLPPFRIEAAKALVQIKKVRQAAGRVRDLDVQSAHLQDHAEKVRSGALSQAEKDALIMDMETMMAKRDERRGHAVTKLRAEIQARQPKVSVALEKLNAALKHVSRRVLASRELLAIAKAQFEKTPALRKRRPTADDLHTIRKAAKRARYVAENAGAKAATLAAKRYEHLQELGGDWHDWLELTTSARKELGKRHATAEEFRVSRDHNLARYREELIKFAPPQIAKPRRAAGTKK